MDDCNMSQPATLKRTHNGMPSAFKRAVALFEKGEIAAAIAGYKEILRQDNQHIHAWTNLGMALRKLGQFEASIACTKRALEISPENVSALTNLGNCLVDVNRIDEAVLMHEKALSLKPDDFLVRRNYSIALREAGLFEKALAEFEILHKMKPTDISVEWERAITYLYLERFSEGWKAFEIRWKLPSMAERPSNVPRWQGEDIKGKTLLIHAEQGFGDTILCSRYIPFIQARGGKVVLECNKALHRLFSTVPGIVGMAEVGQVVFGIDYHIPMMSLPGIFKTDLSSIPPLPTLHVPHSLPPEAARLLGLGKDRLKIGIVWSGSVTFANNRKRAVGVDKFLPLTEIPNVQLYSLQKGPCEEDLEKNGAEELIIPLGPHLNDFADTAAVLKELDLIIMTDSSVAHLAGSLGTPVWNLLSYRPYWLYLSDRKDSPWYASMKLFRQKTPGDWDGVFKEVALTVRHMAMN